MMRVDVNAFVGHYPFRRIRDGSLGGLLRTMERNGIDRAWVSNLSGVFYRDPTEGNEVLFRTVAGHPELAPVPAVHPGYPNWERAIDTAKREGAPAIRIDAGHYGLSIGSQELARAVAVAVEYQFPIVMAVRLEDGRQRHPNDGSSELTPAGVRQLLRLPSQPRLIVTHADRDFIEQVHFGSTPEEAARALWEICWIWGPPMDDLHHLVNTIGADRFCFGTGFPLRLAESSVAKLELSGLSDDAVTAIDRLNLERFLGSPTGHRDGGPPGGPVAQ